MTSMLSALRVAAHSVVPWWRVLIASAWALTACSSGSHNSGNNSLTSTTTTYTLGGTVSGLNASGLILGINGTTVQVNSGATSFAFPTGLATGTLYTVIVHSSPPGLTCSVANGTGTMSTADIANVVVTCSPQSYTLGGTVTGLISGGLVLANGTDRFTVPLNATTFTMPTSVASTSSYAVTIATQATGLSCAVQNGTGSMGTANITSVVVACSDQSYTLGGTITGLNGSGLVLANGSDTLQVSVNATTFTLPTRVAYTTPYVVTVLTQPVGLTCSVVAGPSSGSMPAANITNVAVTCGLGGWCQYHRFDR
jgi:hypothetical protein